MFAAYFEFFPLFIQANAAGGEAQEGEGGGIFRLDKWAMAKTFIFRLIFTYCVFSLFRRDPAPATSKPGVPGAVGGPATNMFMKNEMLDMYVYLTETPELTNFTDPSLLFWRLDGVRYGNWEDGEAMDGSYTKTATFKTSEVGL